MDQSPEQPLFERTDWMPMVVLFALAIAFEAGAALLGLHGSQTSLSQLGVYFDGHLYLEIAKSFPLPYSPEGPNYWGHAPGYPALIYLGRLVTFDGINWGLLAVLSSWIPGALAVAAFYLLCKHTAHRPFWAGLLFLAFNPFWLAGAATPHSGPLAILFAILCFLAHVRGALAWAVLWLSLAALSRYPAILLGLPLAFGVLVLRRQVDIRNLATLAIPLIVFGLYDLYLHLHIPGFPGIMQAHTFWWDAGWTWPFEALITEFGSWPRNSSLVFEITYISVALYVVSIVVGFRPSERNHWFLALWVAVMILFHVSLSGINAAYEFPRLVLLAWPAALLILWRAIPVRLPRIAVAAVVVASMVLSVRSVAIQIEVVLLGQGSAHPHLKKTIERLDDNEPHWLTFGGAPEGAHGNPLR